MIFVRQNINRTRDRCLCVTAAVILLAPSSGAALAPSGAGRAVVRAGSVAARGASRVATVTAGAARSAIRSTPRVSEGVGRGMRAMAEMSRAATRAAPRAVAATGRIASRSVETSRVVRTAPREAVRSGREAARAVARFIDVRGPKGQVELKSPLRSAERRQPGRVEAAWAALRSRTTEARTRARSTLPELARRINELNRGAEPTRSVAGAPQRAAASETRPGLVRRFASWLNEKRIERRNNRALRETGEQLGEAFISRATTEPEIEDEPLIASSHRRDLQREQEAELMTPCIAHCGESPSTRVPVREMATIRVTHERRGLFTRTRTTGTIRVPPEVVADVVAQLPAGWQPVRL